MSVSLSFKISTLPHFLTFLKNVTSILNSVLIHLFKTNVYFRTQFIDDVREVMGLPEWMLTVDSRKTRTLHGGTCIQFLLHFKGKFFSFRIDDDDVI